MKPTPPQAIMLRELSRDGACVFADFDGNRHCFRAHNQSWAQINPAVAGALIKRGWLEKTDHRYIISQTGRETLAMLGGSDFECKRPVFTADEIGDLLRSKYPAPEWVYFRELRYGTGYYGNADTEIDAWIMNTWPSKDFLKIAFEIKVYRSDFLKELKNSDKRKPALTVSNQFYFIGPHGLMSKHEMPEECGLMEVYPDGTIKTAKAAPERKINPPTWAFFASAARRMQNVIEK